jgi:DEAD/DEAH box helicase domain-containing protein
MVEGEPFEVQELHYREDEEKVAYVKRVAVDYFTEAVSAKGVWILQHLTRQDSPGLAAEQGEVLVAEKVVGFKKIKMGTLENVGAGEVELPQQEMQTTSIWLAPDPRLLAEISPSRDELLDGLRAVTYLLHQLSAIFLMSDVRDVGSWLGDGSPSEAGVVVTRESAWARLREASTFTPTIYLYDNQPGGIGLAERMFQVLPDLLARARETLGSCACRRGCPSCVGPVNDFGRRVKSVASQLLARLTDGR